MEHYSIPAMEWGDESARGYSEGHRWPKPLVPGRLDSGDLLAQYAALERAL